MSSENKIYPVKIGERAFQLTESGYREQYKRSIEDPENFWAEQAKARLEWMKPWNTTFEGSLETGELSWFKGGQLNVAANCLDRHLETKADQIAIIWEGDDPQESRHITYRELHQEVCLFANALISRGIKKGDRICIYMPMVPQAAVAMLACARIGAIHSVVFGGFSPEALRSRILDADCSALITADEGIRGGKKIPLKANADRALEGCTGVHSCIVYQRTGADIHWQDGRDCWYHELLKEADAHCPAEVMDAEDPLFILYTSGSTGKPKGVLHTSAGYLLYASLTHEIIFDYKEGDIYWCTADVGWVTGHSYIVYGPLANGATTLMFEGVPNYPSSARCWEVVDKHQVNIFYTAPTALRSLMREGDEPVKKTSRKSLRILGTVGEPINPEAWEWYYHVVGDGRCPIVDTWWQTETGGVLLSPIPGATPLKPGAASWPFFGVQPALVNESNEILTGEAEGALVFLTPWPGMMRTVYGDHQRFFDTYLKPFAGRYTSGDGARRDKEGYYWITGRLDDVINVSGHRIGTAEVESALVLHPQVAEAAVVGMPHEIKGQGLYAYVTPMVGVEPSETLHNELLELVKKEIGSFAKPDAIQWAPALPKTRSGKIMRRILRKIAINEVKDLGDTSTLADPTVVEDLVKHRVMV